MRELFTADIPCPDECGNQPRGSAPPDGGGKAVKIFFILGFGSARKFLLKDRKLLQLCFFAFAKAEPIVKLFPSLMVSYERFI